jgi:hypothetical protein
VQWYTPVIPATQEAEIRRLVVQGQLREKVMVAYSSHPSYKGDRKIMDSGWLGKKARPYLKLT